MSQGFTQPLPIPLPVNKGGTGTTTSTGTGSTVLSNSPSLVTPTLGVATATSIVFSPTTGGIIGTTTNDNAEAGKVGEIISSSVTYTTTNLSTTVIANITSISLTAGDWDVWGMVGFFPGGGTMVTSRSCGVNRTSATIASILTPDVTQMSMFDQTAFSGGLAGNLTLPCSVMSLSATTTVYLAATCTFTVSTCSAGGAIIARRVR